MTQQISNKNQANLQSGWEEAYAQHGNNTLWQDDPIPFLPKVIQLLHEQGLNTAIDLGCGDGRNLTALAQAGLLCTGIDLSKTALNRVGQRLSKLGVPAFLIPGDIAELPFADQSVSAATCFDVFGQLPDPKKVLTEARRVLIPGGVFVMNAFTPDDSAFGLGEQIGDRVFCYKNTLFRFFDRSELLDLFADWEILQITQESWIDPPHGDFRPFEHRHESWILFARNAK